MKVIAYTALHYGSDYLAYAIRSVIDHVDEYWVLYAAEGSHGHRTDTPCPDSRETLTAIAQQAAGAKLRWVDGTWPHEGAQRETILDVAPDADYIVVLDADEVWADGLVEWGLDVARRNPIVTRWRVPIIHYWRSFHRCVLHDPAYPERIIRGSMRGKGSFTETIPTDKRINHMGYAQDSRTVSYKQLTHGHRGEWRKDDWFNTVFMANAQTNCHPVGSEYWNPEPVNPWEYMPEFMKQHPYAEMEVIP